MNFLRYLLSKLFLSLYKAVMNLLRSSVSTVKSCLSSQSNRISQNPAKSPLHSWHSRLLYKMRCLMHTQLFYSLTGIYKHSHLSLITYITHFLSHACLLWLSLFWRRGPYSELLKVKTSAADVMLPSRDTRLNFIHLLFSCMIIYCIHAVFIYSL